MIQDWNPRPFNGWPSLLQTRVIGAQLTGILQYVNRFTKKLSAADASESAYMRERVKCIGRGLDKGVLTLSFI